MLWWGSDNLPASAIIKPAEAVTSGKVGCCIWLGDRHVKVFCV